MGEELRDAWNTSILSQSYSQGVKRLSGKQDDFEDDFQMSEELLKSRKLSWATFFKKFSEPVAGGKELNIFTLKPDDESDESEAEIRYPVRKTKAQIQYWITTGKAPCQSVESESSDTDATVSISESETDDCIDSQRSMIAVNEKLLNSCAANLSVNQLSSSSSVDTAAYIINNGNSSKNNPKERCSFNPAFVDNNRIIRSINAAVPRVLLTRLENLPVRPKVIQGIVNDFNHVKGTKSLQDKNFVQNDIRVKNVEGLELNSKNVNVEVSEVTIDSKESGISSLAVENGKKTVGKNKEIMDSDSSSGIMPSVNKTLVNRRRKLYTGDSAILDIVTPSVESMPRFSSHRKSIHPALATPTCTVLRKKRRSYRPRLLIIPRNIAKRRKNQNEMNKSCARDKRDKNKSTISKSKLANSSVVKFSDLVGNRQVEDKISGNSEENVEKAEEKKAPESLRKTEIKTSSIANTSSSSLGSNDVSQIINDELNRSLESRERNLMRKQSVGESQNSESKKRRSDQSSSVDSDSATTAKRMQYMRNVRKNLYETDLRSSVESNSSKGSDSKILVSENDGKNSHSSKKRSIDMVRHDELVPRVILHDFLDIKACCTELEIEINENWLRKQKRGKTETEETNSQSDETPSCIGNRVKSKKLIKTKKTLRKKSNSGTRKSFVTTLKLGSTDAESCSSRTKNPNEGSDRIPTKGGANSSEISLENYGNLIKKPQRAESETDVSESPPDKTSRNIPNIVASNKLTEHRISLEKKQKSITKKSFMTNFNFDDTDSESSRSTILNQDRHFSSKSVENSPKLIPETLSKNLLISSTEPIRNRWETLFVFTSSDDDDILQMMSQSSRRKSERRKSGGTEDKASKLSNSVTTNETKTILKSYEIVSSNSESEGIGSKTVSNISKTHKVKRKYSKRNKAKDSAESESTIFSVKKNEDANTTKNEKLEKQFVGTNELSKVKKGEESPSAGPIMTRNRAKMNSDDSVSPTNSGNSPDLNERQNCRNEMSQDLKKPVDRSPIFGARRANDGTKNNNSVFKNAVSLIEKPKLSPKTARKEFDREIRRMMEAADSEEEDPNLQVLGVSNYNNESKSSGEKVKLSLTRIDESNNEDTMISISKDNAGNTFRDNKCSIKGDNSSVKNDNTLNRRRRRRRKRSTNSTIVYKTKEFWEINSDNS